MCEVEVWVLGFWWSLPRGSIYTTIMELGPKNHNGDGLLGPNSIMAVYMDPLGILEGGLFRAEEALGSWCRDDKDTYGSYRK